MAIDRMWAKFSEKMVDEETGEPVAESGGCVVEFHMGTKPDDLLTDGGVIEKSHPQVAVIRQMERDALSLMRAESPFAEPEPQPPAKDAPPAAQREYKQAHEEWDARRDAHEADLKERAMLLRQHHEHPTLWAVRPAGRPIFRDVEMIRVMIPGDRDNIVDREVRPSDIEAYRPQYNRWKAGKVQAASGVPLAQWPKVTQAQVQELAYFNIKTVEQLAGTQDAHLQNIGPYMALRQQARDWLATARGSAPVDEARAEAKRALEENAELKRQLAELSAAVAEMRGGQPKPQPPQGQQRR